MGVDKDEKNEEINKKKNVGIEGAKGKSCKGCLYFTSLHKSKSQTPSCYGLSKTIPHVSRQLVGEMELEASQEGRDLKDFKYACIGYSVYLENKDNASDKQNKSAELPLCVGLEVLLDKKSDNAHAHKAEDTHAQPQPQPQPQPRTYKPTNSGEDEFFNRFKRNASLVASGVAKNVNKVANHVKETFDDILYPYRRPPK